MGFSGLLLSNDLHVKQWWGFAGVHARVLTVYSRLRKASKGVATPQPSEAYRELTRIEEAAKQFGKSGNYRRISGYQQDLYRSSTRAAGPQVRVAALGPPENQVTTYYSGLAEGLSRYEQLPAMAALKELDRATTDLHNIVSVVLLVAYGETRVILGGDADKESWSMIREDAPRQISGDTLKAHLVKVSHHGSETAFCPSVWQEHDRPHAIVTPFLNVLPREEMLDYIGRHATKIYATSLPARVEPSPSLSSWRLRMPERACAPFWACPTQHIGRSFLFDAHENLISDRPILFGECIL